jgi:HD-GYP domain-containing protein (c-di-GMP phosphodiesterase class II)
MILTTLLHAAQSPHSKQVARISGLLAAKAGYSTCEVSVITQAAALHDVGKIAVPASILDKPAALTPEEYANVKTHTTAGYEQISEAIKVLTAAAVICREHHEKWDGANGYIGLKGENIHTLARLVSVADVCDTLFSQRVYKAPWDAAAVRTYFIDQAGKQFDAFFAGVLLDIFDDIIQFYTQNNSKGEYLHND